mgnify:CR=1 FL=1|tara:strand:+ start:1652 stop:2674 length:1023 start_codon:yes stop_codon:yes gene_type:complete
MEILICNNGIGDKLVDLIGFNTLCKIQNIKFKIVFNDIIKEYKFGMKNYYDCNLFIFENMDVVNHYENNNEDEIIIMPQKFNKNHKKYGIKGLENQPGDYDIPVAIKEKVWGKYFWPTGTYNIPRIFRQLKYKYSLEYITKKYIETAEMIKPCKYIDNLIPEDIQKCYGVHLRRSDKIISEKEFKEKKSVNSHVWCNSLSEYDKIIEDTKSYILDSINKGINKLFFVCSEDIEYKNKFKEWIINNGGKVIDIEAPSHENNEQILPILDIFCLSKCKLIIQGIKYSSFSVIASLIGNKKIINFHDNKDENLINLYKSAINVNGDNLDMEVCNSILDKTFPE